MLTTVCDTPQAAHARFAHMVAVLRAMASTLSTITPTA